MNTIVPRQARLLYRTNIYRFAMVNEHVKWKYVCELLEWCKTHIGANNWRYYGEYTETPYDLCFRYEEDLIYFKLAFHDVAG